MRAARVQRFIRRERVRYGRRVRLNLRNVLAAVNVRSLKMTKVCVRMCMHVHACDE